MKKIVFVCNHLYGGGAERVLCTLANSFSNCGYDIEILVFDGKKRYPLNNKIIVKDIGDSNSLFKQSKRIRHEIAKTTTDAVISFEYFVNLCTILACSNMKCKVIVSERNDPSIVGSGVLKDRLRNFLYRFCDTLVCQTEDAKKYFPYYIQKNAVVILNPLKNGLPEPWRGKRKDEIVSFGRLNKQKNLSLLIEAFAEFYINHPTFKLAIFGDGEEYDKLIRLVKEKHLDKAVEISHSRTDIHERIVNSKIYVSSSDYEGLSNSMLEAMAIGLPTICTDCPCGGARMVISNGINGVLIPVGDKNALVSALEKLSENYELADNISTNASTLREKLSVDKITEQWAHLL